MDSPVLPLELLYRVINNIDAASPEGQESLSACSYTNHVLNIICQEKLFRDVEISYLFLRDEGHRFVFWDNDGTTGHKFLDLLSGSPHIGSYIQNFTIKAMKSTGQPESFASSSLSDASSSAPSFSLYKILPQLSNLKGFIINHTSSDFYNWSDVEQRTRSYLISIVPFVTKLHLHRFDGLPLSMFSGCVNLQELGFSYPEMDTKDVAQSSVGKVRLQALEVGHSTTLRGPLISCFNTHSSLNISQLRSLKFSYSSCPVSDIDEMLKLCSETLEELDFYLATYGNRTQTPNLGLLYNLRHLTIRIYIHTNVTLGVKRLNADLLDVATILKTLPFDASMRLRLTLLAIVFRISDFDDSLALVPGWTPLITVLDDDQLPHFFADVKLVFKWFKGDGIPIRLSMSLPALTDILDKNEGLKKLRKKGVLSVVIQLLLSRETCKVHSYAST